MSGQGARDLLDQLREIAHMDHATCSEALAALPGIRPPSRLRAPTLRRLLAYEIQASVFGGLSPKEQRALKVIAGGKSASEVKAASASPGTHLVREGAVRQMRTSLY